MRDRLTRLSKKQQNVCALKREANNARIEAKNAQRSLEFTEKRAEANARNYHKALLEKKTTQESMTATTKKLKAAEVQVSRLSKKQENVCALKREVNNARIATKNAQRSLQISEERFVNAMIRMNCCSCKTN